MKTITLNKKIYELNDEAYILLQSYINDIAEHFKDEAEAVVEITSALTERIEEMFIERADKTLDKSDVKMLIKQFGTIDQIKGAEVEDDQMLDSQIIHKKLYRDTEKGWIGGVAAGLAVYFDIPVWIVRTVFLMALVTPIPMIIIYLLLWFVLPPVITKSDKLRMYGQPVSLSTLSNDDGYTKQRVMTVAKVLGVFVALLALFFMMVITVIIAGIIKFGILADDVYITKSDGTSVQMNSVMEGRFGEIDVLMPNLKISYKCSSGEEYDLNTFSNNPELLLLEQKGYAMNYLQVEDNTYQATIEDSSWPKQIIIDSEKREMTLQDDGALQDRCGINAVKTFNSEDIDRITK